MYDLAPIGKIECFGNQTRIQVDQKFNKALKYVDQFSHIHVFYISEKHEKLKMIKEVIKVSNVDIKNGCIISDTLIENLLVNPTVNQTGTRTENIEQYTLIDIKPYFPSEDRIKRPEYSRNFNENHMQIQKGDDESGYNISPLGMIRNLNGKMYIQLDQMIAVNAKHIIVYWWFDKFDKDIYRRVTECDPPYENAPKSGIFATRSPVRPNPIAMTVAQVIKVDQVNKRVYISEIESFDKTPCIGISEYDSAHNTLETCKLPQWLSHWPQYIKEINNNIIDDEVKIVDSELSKIIYERTVLNQDSDTSEDRHELIEKQHLEEQSTSSKPEAIHVYGARENNLKGIEVCVPYGKITAVVGVSGSGKSSLVNDTIYAECNRRMAYLGSNHNVLSKPKIDDMTGCIPTVIIQQDPIRGNSLSTVGTYSDAYDYLRMIYASISVRHCPNCGQEIIPLTSQKINALLNEHSKIYDLEGNRITETSIENKVNTALEKGNGACYAELEKGNKVLLQTKQKCFHCDTLMFEMTPSTFSYIDPDCRCPVCNGTGKVMTVDENKLIEHPELSILDGASSVYGKLRTFRDNPNANWLKGQVIGLADMMNIDLEKPWRELSDEFKKSILYGTNQEVTYHYDNKKNGRNGEITRQVEGLVKSIERLYEKNPTSNIPEKYMTKVNCRTCGGERLRLEGRSATIFHVRYPEAAKMTFSEIEGFCIMLKKNLAIEEFKKIENQVHSILEISKAAIQLGIGYLQLNQETATLSGGEVQRLKLLRAFRNHISGILYVFDEPSKGLHPTDYKKIVGLFKKLVDEGNTIIMVEHNEDLIKIADYIIEIGPGAGKKGGYLVGEGSLKAMLQHSGTQIRKYMGQNSNLRKAYKNEKIASLQFIEMNHLTYNNLQNVNVKFPINALTCICGVSGSGKSSLVKGEIFVRSQKRDDFKNVFMVDQAPIGKNSKSIIATYIGVMDLIRNDFSLTNEAKSLAMDSKYFSFNNPSGQCATCKGEGKIKIQFLENSYITCPDCKGKRYKKQILEIKYLDKNIDEILNMSVDEAIVFENQNDVILQKIVALQRVGLGYLKLGQGTSTLSGGESARLKLARELMGGTGKGNLYLLDEPTTGLHFSDIEYLIKLIRELINNGNTVIAIEHNKQFIGNCDWKIEMGPGASKNGGKIIYQGINKESE